MLGLTMYASNFDKSSHTLKLDPALHSPFVALPHPRTTVQPSSNVATLLPAHIKNTTDNSSVALIQKHALASSSAPATNADVIVFRPHYFGGKNNADDRIFVPLCLKAVLKCNPTVEVYFVHNDPSFDLPGEPRFHGYLMSEFESEESRRFNASYVHLSTNPYLFEKYSIMSYFYVKTLMEHLQVKEAIVVETDVLVFCDLWATMRDYYMKARPVHAILEDRMVMSSSYVTSLYLETFVNVALAFYEDTEILEGLRTIAGSLKEGGITDMTINNWMGSEQVYEGKFVTMNAAHTAVYIHELSVLLPADDDACALCPPSFFSKPVTAWNLSFGQFETDLETCGPVIRIHNIHGVPHGRLVSDGRYVRLNSLHFQGSAKKLIPRVFEEYMMSSASSPSTVLSTSNMAGSEWLPTSA